MASSNLPRRADTLALQLGPANLGVDVALDREPLGVVGHRGGLVVPALGVDRVSQVRRGARQVAVIADVLEDLEPASIHGLRRHRIAREHLHVPGVAEHRGQRDLIAQLAGQRIRVRDEPTGLREPTAHRLQPGARPAHTDLDLAISVALSQDREQSADPLVGGGGARFDREGPPPEDLALLASISGRLACSRARS